MLEMSSSVPPAAPSPSTSDGVPPRVVTIPNAVTLEETRLVCRMWKGGHPLDASAMIISNQMSQMLVLFPSCVAKLGWWMPLVTTIFGLLSCWTAHLVQFFYNRYYPTDAQFNFDSKNESLQWDKLLSDSFLYRGGQWEKLSKIFGMCFNGLCQLTRCIIQLTYAASIIYFVIGKTAKRNWTIILACCCLLFAAFPSLRKYRIFSILSLGTATVAAVSIAVASLRYKPVQRVKHSVGSSSIRSWAWASSIIVYTFGDTPVSVETIVAMEGLDYQRQFRYVFLGSTAYATVLSLLEALISYWVFGDELSKISPAAQPCALAVLPPSPWRDVASISLLILELFAIGHSLSPLFTYLSRFLFPSPLCSEEIWHFCARAFVVGSICVVAVAIPFAGSLEITSLVGSLIVSPAVYLIPAVAHMIYFKYRANRVAAGMSFLALFPLYVFNIIQLTGGLIFVAIIGGLLTSIQKIVHSHTFHRSDFWNKCYACADLWLSPALAPINAPAPAPASQFVHFLMNNTAMYNSTGC